MNPIEPISLAEIGAARGRIAGLATRTPLLPLQGDQAAPRIWLKPENLQPIGSFKLRGAANAMALTDPDRLARGVYTASAGNMAQGVGFVARARGIDWSVVVPDHAPKTKLAAIQRLGGHVVKVPFDRWWQVIVDHAFEALDGEFIHPVADRRVMAGNGTIGLELLEDCDDLDAVVVPYGGGGLSVGIASAIKARRPEVKVFAAEVETAAPLSAALAAGHPVDVEYTASFVDGIGSRGVLPEMWPLVQSLIDGSIVVSLPQVASAMRLLLERNRLVAEGAGAAAVAAALTGGAGPGRVVAVVSGGNIDLDTLWRAIG